MEWMWLKKVVKEMRVHGKENKVEKKENKDDY